MEMSEKAGVSNATRKKRKRKHHQVTTITTNEGQIANKKASKSPRVKLIEKSTPVDSKIANQNTKKKGQKNQRRRQPTWFLAIPVSDPEVHLGVKQAQQIIVDLCPELRQSAVPVSKVGFHAFRFL